VKLRISSVIQSVSPAGECLHLYIYRDDVDEGIGAGQSCCRVVRSKGVGYSSRMLVLSCAIPAQLSELGFSHRAPRLALRDCVISGHESYGLGVSAPIELDEMDSW
jgi:hypothetical protein